MSVAMLITSFAAFAAEDTEDTAVKSAVSESVESYLKAFGIFSASEIIDNSQITRAQAADYFVKAAGFDYSSISGEAASFTDVAVGSETWKISEAALRLGIVTLNDEKMFYPSRSVSIAEAAAMAVRTMKAEPIAKVRGGYPDGYMEIARDSYILNDTSGNANITKADAAMMIYNMYNAYKYNTSYDGDKISYGKSSDTTVVEDLLNVKKYRVDFLNTNSSDNSIEVEYIGGERRGETEKLYAVKKIDVSLIGGSGYIYVSKDTSEIVFVEVKKGSDVQFDYIDAVNRLENISPVQAGSIDYIHLKNAGKEYKVAENATFYYEDKKVTTEAYDYIGKFVKVIVQDDEIIRVDAYPLKEGGLVRYAVTEELRFDVSEDVTHWYNMNDFSTLEVYIDGIKVDGILDLRENYVFDYWYDKQQNKMMIVASSRAAYGTVTGYTNKTIKIDGVTYDIDPSTCCNFDIKADEYKQGVDYSDISGQKISAYFSDDMMVRFIHIDTVNTHTDVVRGVITNAYIEKGTGDKYIKVFHIDDNSGEHTYKVANKLKSGSLSFAYAQSVSQDYEGGGFLEFKLNSDGEIRNIGYVEYFGYTSTFNEHNIQNNTVVCGQYTGEAKWFLLLNINGEFTVRKTTYSQMQYMHPTGTARFVTDYNVRYNPVPQYFMGLGWENSYTAFESYGFVSDIQYVDDEYSKLVLTGTSSFTVSNKLINDNNIKINSYLKYRATRGCEDPIIVYEVRDFSGDPDTWDVDTWTPTSTTGLFRADDLVYRNDYVAQFIIDGQYTDTYKFKDDGITVGGPCTAYRHNRDSFEIVSVKFGQTVDYARISRGAQTMNLRKGDKIWFYLDSHRQLSWFIFEPGPDSYEQE